MTPHESLPSSVQQTLYSEELTVNYLQLWGYSGFLYEKSININQNKHFYRQRWTICHELGHYIHWDTQTLIGVKFWHSEQEKKADLYAMDTLLPINELLEQAEYYEWDLNKLEIHFWVEKKYIEKRIKNILWE